METPTKKRNLPQGDAHDDEDNEEIKIEKFFALVKSIREARDRFPNGSDTSKQEMDCKNKKRKLEEENKRQFAVWKPCFQPEDFLEEFHARKSWATVAITPQKSEVLPTQEEAKEELDLRLSL
ncbi:uncharacterized protein LOC110627209 [Manihot esculenta]|uniref:Uncharacterized protein n=1 Tax=Manihot esculenta TaxID=3983 RepID=A0A2C9WQU0_MANES|nr:uncharacterized protein LOC110627209 [Manihot esculenta]OAY61976.1 hypothetical protein MANES_01G232200v8 [Manihot esculenta]